jgi:hypothetical protein
MEEEETIMNQSTRSTATAEPNSGPTPEHKVHFGRVDVAVWKRQSQSDDRSWYSFSVSRSYKDKDDQWQRTSNLDEEDLLPAARALEEAYAWVQGQRQKARDETFRELRPPSTP